MPDMPAPEFQLASSIWSSYTPKLKPVHSSIAFANVLSFSGVESLIVIILLI